MTPTPAQIEAAAQALFFCQNAIMHDHQLEWRKANKKLWQECAAAALTAAAAVGTDQDEYDRIASEITAVRRDAYERCAQVAETAGDHSSRALTIAAAIRALKDKP